MNRISRSAGKVNVSEMAKMILGIPTSVQPKEMNDTQRKDFHAVCGVFRGHTNGRSEMGGFKTGKGMKLIEKFVTSK